MGAGGINKYPGKQEKAGFTLENLFGAEWYVIFWTHIKWYCEGYCRGGDDVQVTVNGLLFQGTFDIKFK